MYYKSLKSVAYAQRQLNRYLNKQHESLADFIEQYYDASLRRPIGFWQDDPDEHAQGPNRASQVSYDKGKKKRTGRYVVPLRDGTSVSSRACHLKSSSAHEVRRSLLWHAQARGP